MVLITINTDLSGSCSGNGQEECTPSNQLLQMSDDYITNGIGTLACDQGQDVVYPEGAPGFVYDPTGYLLTLPGRQVSCCTLSAE